MILTGLKYWSLNVLISLDQLLNTIFLGAPDETISSRAGKARARGDWWGCYLCLFLDWIDPRHCETSREDDEGSNGVLERLRRDKALEGPFLMEKAMPPEHYVIAEKHIGLTEFKGKGKHNADIIDFSKSLGHSWVKTDEVPWCAAFVGACLEEAGVESTKKLNARSYMKWGKRVWGKPKIGDVVVFKRGTSKWQGHVAFYAGETKHHIKCLGGNQSNMVKVSLYKKSKLLGIRRAELSKPPPDMEIEDNEIGEKEIEQSGSRTIKHAKGNKDAGGAVIGVGVLGVLAKTLEYVEGLGEALGDWAGSIDTISNALTQLLALWPVALLVCGGIVIWRNKEIIKARISDEPLIGRVKNASPD